MTLEIFKSHSEGDNKTENEMAVNTDNYQLFSIRKTEM